MSISEPFIRRPVATILIMVAIAFFGVLAFVRLPVSALPNVDFPTIQVSAQLPGASAETMAASVATPLEREFSTIDGLDSMTSSSSLGATQVTLQFSSDRDLDSAAQDVQSALSRASRRLPPDMPSPPYYRKVNPADQPILYLSLSSDVLPTHQVNEYAETDLAQRISTISGVAQVMVYGSQKYAVRIQVDPDALVNRGIGIDQVAEAIRGGNSNSPTGTLYGASKAFTIQSNGQLTTAEQYRPLVVAYRNGAPVRIEDIGRVLDSVENDKTAAWTVDQRSVVLAIQKQPGANTVAVSEAVKELLPDFRSTLPASVKLETLFDRSESVKESVHEVEFTLLLTLFLVVLVIFLFLRRLSATIIPSLAMPLSVFGTFAVMYMLGYSLNNLTLMALTLSIGFVVDDAIVMLENVVRHMEMGKPPLQAALEGAREVGFTIVSMTLSLVAVFVPFLFMGGIVGMLFEEFAVSIAVAILFSGFVSLTLTPMMAARLVRPEAEDRHGKLYLVIERAFEWTVGIYDKTLGRVLRHPRLVLALSGGVLAATVYLFQIIPKGFLPNEDQGQVVVMTEAVEGISFDAVREQQLHVNEILRQSPHVASFMSSVGTRGTFGASNTGMVFMRLKPRGERPHIEQVVAELRQQLSKIPGMRAFVQVPPPIRIGGRLTKSEYQLTLQGTDPRQLYDHAPALAAEMEKLPMLRDVTTDLQLKNAELRLDINRDRAASLGVSPAQIEDALYSAYGNRQVSLIYAPQNTYQVILELAPETQNTPTALDKLHVRSQSGELIPLKSLADLHEGVGPLSVNHAGQLSAVTISFNLQPGYGLSQAVERIEALALQTLPAGISTQFQGAAEAFQSSFAGLGLLLAISIFVIYLVLGILYESFIHPLTILTALPFAGFGALATLLVFGVDLNVYAFVGIILLVGLVKKNGIMMVDFALELQREGVGPTEAIHRASVVRFRPIMMTTMAALLGVLPIALGLGAGGESRMPLGLAVVGGLLFSQMLTLFVTPVFFVYMDRVAARLSRKRQRDTETAPSYAG